MSEEKLAHDDASDLGTKNEGSQMLSTNGKMPIIVLVAIVIQTATCVWWASGLSTTVASQGESIKELRAAVGALTAAKVMVLEAELAQLRSEIIAGRQTEKKNRGP